MIAKQYDESFSIPFSVSVTFLLSSTNKEDLKNKWNRYPWAPAKKRIKMVTNNKFIASYAVSSIV